jgi:SPP1 family phage portal protein
MTLQKTNKAILTNEEILKYISDYEINTVKHLDDLWEYYKGKNVKITERKIPDNNNPDNKVIASYGRKIVTTYTGYGYRPKYITYKPNVKKTNTEIENTENDLSNEKTDPVEKKFCNEIQNIYKYNNEHIKTNRAGRNLGIFGFNYELLYIDSEYDKKELTNKAVPKFFTVDPRQMVVLYNYDPEPKIIIAIRFYPMNKNEYKVEVYYKDNMIPYIRYREETNNNVNEWKLKTDGKVMPNYFNDVPVIAFYRGDEMQSIIENVLSLIDAYDVLMSDSMNEFDRFAFAYLIMKNISLTNPIDKKDPVKAAAALEKVKRRRIFEGLDKDSDIHFLTKDIPTQFIEYMARKLKEEIHLQSHVPDFTLLTGALSGAAIDRLLFDFENLVSSDEADFDVALIRRGEMITDYLIKMNAIPRDSDFSMMINIMHKRNLPLDKNMYATLAYTLTTAGFSRKMIISQMPEDMVSDVEDELAEEEKERNDMVGIDGTSLNEGFDEDEDENIEDNNEE